MDRVRALDRLIGHQDHILAIVARGEALLEGPPAKAVPALARDRWVLVRALREYQLFKHIEIFDPLIAYADRDAARAATGMKARCIAAGKAYSDHAQRWSMADVASRWPDYSAAAQDAATSIRSHLESERAGAVLLLGNRQRTRDRAQPLD